MSTYRMSIMGALLVSAAIWPMGHAGAQGYDLPLAPLFSEGNEYVVFGYVQDQDGDLVPNAIVRIAIQRMRVTYIERTDYRGRYRRSGLSPELEAAEIQITCEKVGFQQVRLNKMKAPGKIHGIIEANCILGRLDS
jgi:hypothetical protein